MNHSATENNENCQTESTFLTKHSNGRRKKENNNNVFHSSSRINFLDKFDNRGCPDLHNISQ